jgi:hypothetical protein
MHNSQDIMEMIAESDKRISVDKKKKKKKGNANEKDILQLSYHPPSQSHHASALSGWEGASRISEPPGTESSSPEHPHN